MWPVGRTIKIRVFRVIRVIRDLRRTRPNATCIQTMNTSILPLIFGFYSTHVAPLGQWPLGLSPRSTH